MSRRGRWYGNIGSGGTSGLLLPADEPRGVVQVEHDLRDTRNRSTRLTFPEHVLRLAQAEYERQFGTQQDYERMQERGGLGVLEVVGLLADYVERLGGKPTRPRADSGTPPAKEKA